MLQKHIQIQRVTSNKLECLPLGGNEEGMEGRKKKRKKGGSKRGERGRGMKEACSRI